MSPSRMRNAECGMRIGSIAECGKWIGPITDCRMRIAECVLELFLG